MTQKIIEVIGTSKESFAKAAEAAVLFSIILSQSTTFTRPLGMLFRGV